MAVELVLDTRKLKPGDVFVAYPGLEQDGRHYIVQAIEQGASAIWYDPEGGFIPAQQTVPMVPIAQLSKKLPDLAAEFYKFPAKALRMVGVTGTSGKTSVCHLLAQALQILKKPCGVIGTLGNGVFPGLDDSSMATPDPCTLQRLFQAFKDQECETVAMEVSSHALDQHRLGSTDIEIGVFTNLSQDHLDYHHTMEAYAATKATLFAKHVTRLAILNREDVCFEQMKRACQSSTKILTFGLIEGADIYVTHLDSRLRGNDTVKHVTVKTPWGICEYDWHLMGIGNLRNSLTVLGILHELGYELSEIAQALGQCHEVRGRMEVIHHQPLVVIDFAHKPDALSKALQSLRATCSGKLWVVFGCGGNRDRGKRPLMAEIAEGYADHVMVSEDNNRHESFEQIRHEIFAGFQVLEKILCEPDRQKAIEQVLKLAKPEDTVLLAGKGHECYIISQGLKRPFSEREVVQNYFNGFPPARE